MRGNDFVKVLSSRAHEQPADYSDRGRGEDREEKAPHVAPEVVLIPPAQCSRDKVAKKRGSDEATGERQDCSATLSRLALAVSSLNHHDECDWETNEQRERVDASHRRDAEDGACSTGSNDGAAPKTVDD